MIQVQYLLYIIYILTQQSSSSQLLTEDEEDEEDKVNASQMEYAGVQKKINLWTLL